MAWAIEIVDNRELGINWSALEYGVPETTLKDWIAGKVKRGTK